MKTIFLALLLLLAPVFAYASPCMVCGYGCNVIVAEDECYQVTVWLSCSVDAQGNEQWIRESGYYVTEKACWVASEVE